MNSKLASKSHCPWVFLRIRASKNFVKFLKRLKNAKYEMPQTLFIQVNQSSIEIFRIIKILFFYVREEKVRGLLIQGGKLASF